MTTKAALLNPANGVVYSWTKELSKREDLVLVNVDEKFNIIEVDAGIDPEPVVVADEDHVEVKTKPKRGRKKKE